MATATQIVEVALDAQRERRVAFVAVVAQAVAGVVGEVVMAVATGHRTVIRVLEGNR